MFVGSRLPIFLLASVFAGFVPVSPERLQSFPAIFGYWDAGWYLQIAEGGYEWSGSFVKESRLAFFPLYPFLGKLVHHSPVTTFGVLMAIVAIYYFTGTFWVE